jgi:hypothetical protein
VGNDLFNGTKEAGNFKLPRNFPFGLLQFIISEECFFWHIGGTAIFVQIEDFKDRNGFHWFGLKGSDVLNADSANLR